METQLLLRIYDAAGIADATSHSGRRTFITNLAAKGIGVRVLAELAAHSMVLLIGVVRNFSKSPALALLFFICVCVSFSSYPYAVGRLALIF